MRNAGTIQMLDAGDGFIRFRIADAPPQLRKSHAWRTLLEGFAGGLLELGRIPGEVQIRPAPDEPRAVDLLGMW